MLRGAFKRRLLQTFLASAVASSAITSTAVAGPLVEAAGACQAAQLSEPFLRWLDPMHYTPVDDGGIERRAAGWQLTGGATPVLGNEPWTVGAVTDRRSLSLPEGASATTAPICVGIAEPTLRFFARSASAGRAELTVEVLFEDAAGTVRALPIGTDAGGPWHPTAVMPVIANLLPLVPGEQTPVAFRFTARRGAVQIDDVYVDPWCQR